MSEGFACSGTTSVVRAVIAVDSVDDAVTLWVGAFPAEVAHRNGDTADTKTMTGGLVKAPRGVGLQGHDGRGREKEEMSERGRKREGKKRVRAKEAEEEISVLRPPKAPGCSGFKGG